jgi:aspartyl aminopeptidase
LDASRQRAWQAAKEVIASQVQGQEVSELLIPHLHIHIDRKVNAHVHINIHMQFIMLVDALTPSQL